MFTYILLYVGDVKIIFKNNLCGPTSCFKLLKFEDQPILADPQGSF